MSNSTLATLSENRHLHFIDCFNRTHNPLVLGKMGTGCREL